MITLLPNECRVLGVLVEKALTVPASYPLTLNAIVVGCNQKNNRDPLTSLDEEAALDALDALRKKGLVFEVSFTGSRVAKYRHVAREALALTTEQLAIVTELMLRGPQSPGELRTHASRMVALDSLEKTVETIASLIDRPEPLVRELPPSARARRFGQLLCPDLHPTEAPTEPGGHAPSPRPASTGPAAEAAPGAADVAARLARLEAQHAELLARLKAVEARLPPPGTPPDMA